MASMSRVSIIHSLNWLSAMRLTTIRRTSFSKPAGRALKTGRLPPRRPRSSAGPPQRLGLRTRIMEIVCGAALRFE
jgi:hypothetical protein